MPRPLSQPVPVDKPRLLVGEGEDEVNFFKALIAKCQVGDFQIEQYGGKDKLTVYLRGLRVRTGHERLASLAVTRDADTSCSNAFASIRAALSAAGLACPAAPGEWSTGNPRVGVFIMPDNQRPGMLEHLCLDSITTDPAFRCLEQYFQCIQDLTLPLPSNLAKGKVHAWLATRAEPGRSLGLGALQDAWPLDGPTFQTLTDFLRSGATP